MKSHSFLILFLLLSFTVKAQSELETYPVFEECKNSEQQNNCFKSQLINHLAESYNHPDSLDESESVARVLFEVDTIGKFNVIYINAIDQKIKSEIQKSFDSLPKIKPATYNGEARFIRFTIPLSIPIYNTEEININETKILEEKKKNPLQEEYDQLKNQQFNDDQFNSYLNIPLSHEVYNRFDKELNRIGTNTHTSSKPYSYKDIEPYYNFEKEVNDLRFDKKTWLGKKFFNEDLVTIKGEDYWLTFNIAADLQLGKDTESDESYTYNNTRAAYIQGQLGKKFNFFTAIYESQARFADYYNAYAESIKPVGGNPATIPSRGIAKRFNENAYDYPIAEGYISYKPSKYFKLQLGHGQNFIGDGHRSLFISDNASIHPYFKIETNIWKLKYTNTWRSLRDTRDEVTDNGSYRTKYMATHHLSYNITKRLNIGLFESVIWQNDNDRGFDFNYINPVIFYHMIEFSTGSKGGNALIGLSYKYKWTDNINSYGQLIIDEFATSDIFGGQNSWRNKLGFQLGVKYFDAFKVKDLNLQLEYNEVRPYTYSHYTGVLNYGHNGQSLAHQWGANFREFIAIARYRKDRWFGHAKFIAGTRGLEKNDDLDPFYGGNIYGNERDRIKDNNIKIGYGNKVKQLFGELEVGYLINPKTNLKLYTRIIHRSFKPEETTATVFEDNTTWFNFGFRTDLFNWYYNY
ncbi:MAG: gliding motility protein RemB [Psychroflexus halocasei]|uniref:gliding motility protein RemB n=1 Tax=Psychroflexus sp. S27 TaxID=1982757 RepID=UPI000C29ABB3|nr:gliding motility protein RemB [Psychroflexus sp. S27]PJX22682.1 gliding motility protein RemB [Psychroflexus sp. S27]